MFKKSDFDINLERKINKQKKEINDSFQKNIESQERMLDFFIVGINHADFNKFKDTRLIWNISGFINIVSLDLKVIGRDLTFAENEWQKRYYARQACLLIYESFNDIFGLLGKDFKELFCTKINDDQLDEIIKSIKSELNQFKDKYIAKIKVIRHNAIGHRDNDILKQIEQINSISWSESIEIVSCFDRILNELGIVFQELIDYGLKEFDELKKSK